MTQWSKMVLSLIVISFAGALAVAADDPIKDRKEVMKDNGKSIGVVVKMVKGEIEFDAAKAEEALKKISSSADKFRDLFPEGSIEAASTDSKYSAKEDIWKNLKDFGERLDSLKATSLKVADAATKEGKEALAASISELGKVCKGCHEKYRLKRKE